MRALLLLVLGATAVNAFRCHVHRARAKAMRACAIRAQESDDLMASLRARLNAQQSGVTGPLGPDDVGADQMGPADVIEYCMTALKASAAADAVDDLNGWRVLLSFSLALEGKVEDALGQVQPGTFRDPQKLKDYLASQVRYESFLAISEYKYMGVPEMCR